MNYLFDTTAYSQLVRGHKRVADMVKDAEIIYMPNVVVAELRFGFRFGNRQEENERLLVRFLAKQKVRITLPDNATTEYFVDIAAHARRNGVQLSSHDMWIAAFAEQKDITLVSFDKDFKHLNYASLRLLLESD